MNGLKYITFQGPMHIEIVIFANARDHAAMASMLDIRKEEIIGAGFVSCNQYNVEPRCIGKSTSLGISADGLDSLILQRHMGWET